MRFVGTLFTSENTCSWIGFCYVIDVDQHYFLEWNYFARDGSVGRTAISLYSNIRVILE